jgi:hypothetical protein
VFGSSRAKNKASAGSTARAAVTSRSAAGDLWSGFKPSARASVLSASSAPDRGGLSGTAVAALAMLGLGLTGAIGAMSFVGLRSRRAKSRSAGTTKM